MATYEEIHIGQTPWWDCQLATIFDWHWRIHCHWNVTVSTITRCSWLWMMHMLDFSTFDQLSTPVAVSFDTLIPWCQLPLFAQSHTYMTPDSNPNMTRFSPFSVNRTDRGITLFTSLTSFQFSLHNMRTIPAHDDTESKVRVSREVLRTIFF